MKERLRQLPIFPLPNGVLIPGGILPLHVFEPRYRQLVEDCVSEDRIFAVAMLCDGHEPTGVGDPAVRPVICLGRIETHQKLEDGRFLVLVHGWLRARIEEELDSPHPYRLVRATPIEDDAAEVAEPLEQAAHSVRQMVLQLVRQHHNDSTQVLADACLKERNPGRLADLIGAAVLQEPEQRQRFLEESSVARRLDEAVDLVAHALVRVSAPSNEELRD